MYKYDKFHEDGGKRKISFIREANLKVIITKSNQQQHDKDGRLIGWKKIENCLSLSFRWESRWESCNKLIEWLLKGTWGVLLKHVAMNENSHNYSMRDDLSLVN